MIRKKKILFLTRSFYPNIGGVEKHILELSKVLIAKGHKISVITEKPYSNNYHSGSSSDKLKGEILGIKIVRIDAGNNNWFKKFRIWLQLLRNIKKIYSADIVHCHDVFFWYLPFRFIFPFKKIYTTFHGYEGNMIPTKKAIFMHKIAEKLSNGNICVGDYLKKWYGTKPDYITYGAVETPNHKLQITNKSKRKNSKYKILFLGRLEEETGIMEYLKALLMLKNIGTKFELTILGDGKLRRKAETFSKSNKINAEFKGFVENTDKYFRVCDFVFTSRYLGILEALAYKKLVFAHYNNPIKEDYLEMAPFSKFISISKNHQGLAKQIEFFLRENETSNDLIGNGFGWVKKQNWSNITDIYSDLWSKI